ncbi:AbgT family transporter [Proteinivorax tanatarense]|uniref:AbgT family transporter n=1 Tax=Proteinivorax tanatarense TaxID=1260629 RepID=A0AAU7VQH1_9FIRM
MKSSTGNQKPKQNWGDKFLNVVEKTGNKLPHPVTLFFIFAATVLVLSFVLSAFDVSAQHPDPDIEEPIKVINLLSREGIRDILTGAVGNFTGFAPLGVVLVAMLGVGVAERSGLIAAMLKKIVMGAPDKLVTAVVVFAGVMSSMASDAGYVVLVPLGAVIFLAKGRHPIAGLAAAFAGVSGGFSSNLIITMIDPLLGGFTQEAARMFDATYSVTPAANLYFMMASTVLITCIGVLITEKVVEPRLGTYTGSYKQDLEPITPREIKSLKIALLALIGFIAVVALMTIPETGILRTDEGALLDDPASPFIGAMIPLISASFFIPGLAYGISAGTIRKDKDVAKFMEETMSTMGGYIVLAFAAAQFVAYFEWSNIGLILAISGAEFLQAINLTGIPLILAFIFVSGIINLFVGSASAKWAIMAPVFVPMLMTMGYSPEVAQLAYRIGDSTTNIISPLMPYFAIIVAFAQKYDKKLGIGTLISTMVPYSIAFMIAWMIMLTIWMLIGLPIGPETPVIY